MLPTPATLLRSSRAAISAPRAAILSSIFKHNTISPFLSLDKSQSWHSTSLYTPNVSGVYLPSSRRQFHQSSFLLNNSGINPNFPDEPSQVPRIRRPGRYFADHLDTTRYRLGNDPIYSSPAGSQIAFTKRASVGLAALSGYIAYLFTMTTSVSSLVAALAVVPLVMPIPIFMYLSKPYVTRIFRLYKKIPPIERTRVLTPEEEEDEAMGFASPRTYLEPQPDTFESIMEDETLVVEQIGAFGRSVRATQIKLSGLRIAPKNETRFGWVNWIYTDPETKEVIKLYVADNVGGIKMDRIWGIIEKNSGIDNGRSFLNQQ